MDASSSETPQANADIADVEVSGRAARGRRSSAFLEATEASLEIAAASSLRSASSELPSHVVTSSKAAGAFASDQHPICNTAQVRTRLSSDTPELREASRKSIAAREKVRPPSMRRMPLSFSASAEDMQKGDIHMVSVVEMVDMELCGVWWFWEVDCQRWKPESMAGAG